MHRPWRLTEHYQPKLSLLVIYGDLVWTPHKRGWLTDSVFLPISVWVINIEMAGLCWYHSHITLIPPATAGCCHQSPLTDWLRSTAEILLENYLGKVTETIENWGHVTRVLGLEGHVSGLQSLITWSALISSIDCWWNTDWWCDIQTTKWISDQGLIKQRNKNRH